MPPIATDDGPRLLLPKITGPLPNQFDKSFLALVDDLICTSQIYIYGEYIYSKSRRQWPGAICPAWHGV
jgi:hypothetical protein